MSQFSPGEVVDITIKAARVTAPRPGHNGSLSLVYAEVEPGIFASIDIDHPETEGIEITRVAPFEWPPQRGDVWRDRQGVVHFGITYSPDFDDKADCEGMGRDGTRVILVASGGDESCRLKSHFYRPEYVNKTYGPLTLVHRERLGEASHQ